jgi:hypothetical protein
LTAVQAVLALAITLAWGPEILAAMEMTALLEILGAGLFITVYVAGLKLKAIELGRALHSMVSPLGQLVLLRSSARGTLKAAAAVSILLNIAWCAGATVVVAAYAQHLYAQVA